MTKKTSRLTYRPAVLGAALALAIGLGGHGSVAAAGRACDCGPECAAAFGRYEALVRKGWDVADYGAFLDRYNALGRGVEVHLARGAQRSPLTQDGWCNAYRYREKQMDKRAAWEGIADLYQAESSAYADGGRAARELHRRLMTEAFSRQALERELARAIDVTGYFPGAMGREKMGARDFMYVYLGSMALAELENQAEALTAAEGMRQRREILKQRGAEATQRLGEIAGGLGVAPTESSAITETVEPGAGLELPLRPFPDIALRDALAAPEIRLPASPLPLARPPHGRLIEALMTPPVMDLKDREGWPIIAWHGRPIPYDHHPDARLDPRIDVNAINASLARAGVGAAVYQVDLRRALPAPGQRRVPINQRYGVIFKDGRSGHNFSAIPWPSGWRTLVSLDVVGTSLAIEGDTQVIYIDLAPGIVSNARGMDTFDAVGQFDKTAPLDNVRVVRSTQKAETGYLILGDILRRAGMAARERARIVDEVARVHDRDLRRGDTFGGELVAKDVPAGVPYEIVGMANARKPVLSIQTRGGPTLWLAPAPGLQPRR